MDSQTRKLDLICGLYSRCQQPEEIKYLIRLLHPAGLRIGLSARSFENSLLKHLENVSPTERNVILDDLEKSVFGYKIDDEAQIKHLNVPVKAMVGRAVKSAGEAV